MDLITPSFLFWLEFIAVAVILFLLFKWLYRNVVKDNNMRLVASALTTLLLMAILFLALIVWVFNTMGHRFSHSH